MPKITLAEKAEILSEVRKKTETNFHMAVHEKEETKAEAALEQDLLNLENDEWNPNTPRSRSS